MIGGSLGLRLSLEGASNEAGDTPTPPEAVEGDGLTEARRAEWDMLKERDMFDPINVGRDRNRSILDAVVIVSDGMGRKPNLQLRKRDSILCQLRDIPLSTQTQHYTKKFVSNGF